MSGSPRAHAAAQFQAPVSAPLSAADLATLADFVAGARRLLVLTGAGCSTESGIPDYRSPGGVWNRHKPMQYRDFVRSAAHRRRYWARSMLGWQTFSGAAPNDAHRALARLEAAGHLHYLVTQNVDRLHHAAGSQRVLELHGTTHLVICLACRRLIPRAEMQGLLEHANPGWQATALAIAPDGDAELAPGAYDGFEVPGCEACGGLLKPAVVFFGENVPAETVAFAMSRLEEADALLVVGSSLTVWSGFRFARAAAQQGKPVALLNIGATRADGLAMLKLEARVGEVLPRLVACLGADRFPAPW